MPCRLQGNIFSFQSYLRSFTFTDLLAVDEPATREALSFLVDWVRRRDTSKDLEIVGYLSIAECV